MYCVFPNANDLIFQTAVSNERTTYTCRLLEIPKFNEPRHIVKVTILFICQGKKVYYFKLIPCILIRLQRVSNITCKKILMVNFRALFIPLRPKKFEHYTEHCLRKFTPAKRKS